MSEKSRDLTATEAIKKIKAMEKAGEVKKFIKGDGRSTVNEAADKAIDKIKEAKGKKKEKKESKAEKVEEKPKEKKKTPSR